MKNLLILKEAMEKGCQTVSDLAKFIKGEWKC